MNVADDVRSEIVADTERMLEAERNGEPIQSGKQRHVSVSKNTHYEYRFGGAGTEYPEVYVYLERLHDRKGLEIMVWANEEWFDSGVEFPRLDDANGDELPELFDTVREVVEGVDEEIELSEIEFHQRVHPSIIFNCQTYI